MTSIETDAREATPPKDAKRSLVAGVLVGAGTMAAVDEIVFHQILAWHHFYDRATPAIALFSDGLLHAAELIAIVAGFSLWNALRGHRTLAARHATSGLHFGLGGFQVFDGIVDRKVLRVHQIRYGVEDLWIYDTVWIASGAAIFIAGWVVYVCAQAATSGRTLA